MLFIFFINATLFLLIYIYMNTLATNDDDDDDDDACVFSFLCGFPSS